MTGDDFEPLPPEELPSDALPYEAKPVPEGMLPCPAANHGGCGGMGTVPVREPDPDHDGGFLEQRFADHSHGSEVCMTCGGKGWIPPMSEPEPTAAPEG